MTVGRLQAVDWAQDPASLHRIAESHVPDEGHDTTFSNVSQAYIDRNGNVFAVLLRPNGTITRGAQAELVSIGADGAIRYFSGRITQVGVTGFTLRTRLGDLETGSDLLSSFFNSDPVEPARDLRAIGVRLGLQPRIQTGTQGGDHDPRLNRVSHAFRYGDDIYAVLLAPSETGTEPDFRIGAPAEVVRIALDGTITYHPGSLSAAWNNEGEVRSLDTDLGRFQVDSRPRHDGWFGWARLPYIRDLGAIRYRLGLPLPPI
jgi:hypothetical protein